MNKLLIILSILLIFSCEKDENTDLRGKWEASNPNYKITMNLFHSGSVITGSGILSSNLELLLSYDITVKGNYLSPGISLIFTTKAKEYTFDGDLIGNKTIQGKLDGYTNLIFKRL